MARLALIVLLVALALAGCDEPSTEQVDRRAQEDILARGQAAEPVYEVRNYLSRRAINEWSRRMDTPDKLWYIYLLSDAGAFIGYHICETVPLSYGVGLTSPERIVSSGGNRYQMPAPGVDGVFYAGTDPSVHYCFDAETEALVTFKTQFVYYDMPLDLDVPQLRLTE